MAEYFWTGNNNNKKSNNNNLDYESSGIIIYKYIS